MIVFDYITSDAQGWPPDRESDTVLELAVRFVQCPFCGAPAKSGCRTASGSAAARPHSDRCWEAWGMTRAPGVGR